MPSYAGAKAAIEARLRAAGIAHANGTPLAIAVENGPEVTKVDGNGESWPWLYLEIQDAGSAQAGIGRPGDQLWTYDGLILVHVFVPVATGNTLASELADRVGDVFRAASFYRDVPGFEVRCWAPRTGDRGSGSDDGLWFRVTASIPFEYWHRG